MKKLFAKVLLVAISPLSALALPTAAQQRPARMLAGTTPGLGAVLNPTSAGAGMTAFVGVYQPVPPLIITSPQSLPGGTYSTVIVAATGTATLTGAVTITDQMVVQAGGTFNTNCQVITGSGSFTLADSATLRICSPAGISASGATGAIQVTGPRVFASGATYVYDGPAAQITGSGLPAIVANLRVANATTVSLSQPLTITRVLTLNTTGNLVLGGQPFILRSDAAGAALVANLSTGRVVGAATVQRATSGASAPGLGWHLVSSPVQAATIADLTTAGFTPVLNSAYNTAANPAAVVPQPTVVGFSEARRRANAAFPFGHYSPTASTDALVVGRGYRVALTPASTPDFVGTLTTGDVSFNGLTRNNGTGRSGWHLLGNPYPSPLNWDSAAAHLPAGISRAVSVYEATGAATGRYLTRVNGIGSLQSGELAIGQGFWARVTRAGNFRLSNTVRTTLYSGPRSYRPTAEMRPLVTVQLGAAGAGAGQQAEATVYFAAGATAGLDEAFDGVAPTLNDGLPTLGTLIGSSESLVVSGLPLAALTAGTVVPLRLDLPATGGYTLAASQLLNLMGTTVQLRDYATSITYDLTTQPTVSFTAATAGTNTTRFALVFGQPLGVAAAADAAELVLFPNPAIGAVQVRLPAGVAHVVLLDVTGRVMRTWDVPGSSTSSRTTTLDLMGVVPGVYALRAGELSRRLVVETGQ